MRRRTHLPGRQGRWFADLTFEGLPTGIPNAIGTPVMRPHASRREAVDQALGMLALLIAAEDRPAAPDAAETVTVFPFDELVVHVPSRFLDSVIAAVRETGAAPPSRAETLRRLEIFRDEVNGGRPITVEAAESWPQEDKARLMAVCAAAILNGIVRYPEFQEAEPATPEEAGPPAAGAGKRG